MKIRSADDAIKLFKDCALSHGQYSLSGNTPMANRQAKLINSAIAFLFSVKQTDLLKSCLHDGNVSVRMWSAFALLPVIPEECEAILQDISKGDHQMISFSAEITLNEWYKGCLKFPRLSTDRPFKVIFQYQTEKNDQQPQTMMKDEETIEDFHHIYVLALDDIDIYHDYKTYCKSMERFSKEQCYIFAIQWYETEVNNGGHNQFLSNPTGIVWKEALEGLKEIGALQLAENLRAVCSKFKSGPPFDRNIRESELDLLNDDMEKEDGAFHQHSDELKYLIKKYISEHRKQFCCNG